MTREDLYAVECAVESLGYLAAAARRIGNEGLIYAHPDGKRCDEADEVMVIIETIEREAKRVSTDVMELGRQMKEAAECSGTP